MSASGAAVRATVTAGNSSASPSSSRVSGGISRCTGRGRPVLSWRNASWTAPGISRDFQHPLAPLGDRLDDVELLVDLVQHADVLAQVAPGHLPGHQEHRRRARVRRAESGAGVQHARPRHHQRHADAAARPRVAVGHVRRGLLVPGQDEPDVLLVAQRRHGAIQLHARQPEHHPHPFTLQLLRERLATGHPHRNSSSRPIGFSTVRAPALPAQSSSGGGSPEHAVRRERGVGRGTKSPSES